MRSSGPASRNGANYCWPKITEVERRAGGQGKGGGCSEAPREKESQERGGESETCTAGKGRQLADLKKWGRYIACAEDQVEGKQDKSRLFCHGVDGKQNGVGVILKEVVKRASDWVMRLKLQIKGVMLNDVGVCARQFGYQKRERGSGVSYEVVVCVSGDWSKRQWTYR